MCSSFFRNSILEGVKWGMKICMAVLSLLKLIEVKKHETLLFGRVCLENALQAF